VVVDALGYPVDLRITAGQDHDITQAAALLTGKHGKYVIGDKAYDAGALIELIIAQGSEPVIPPRACSKPRQYDRHVYKERHLVECFFNRIKQFRRVATRYEKTLRSYRAMILIACILVWTV
jgi:transposase